MVIFLLILGGLLLLLLGLLSTRVSLDWFVGQDKATVTLRYLFLRFRVFSLKEEKVTKEKHGKKKTVKKERVKIAAVEWRELAENAIRAFSVLRRHLVFCRMHIYLCTGAEDAHQAALRCAQVNLAVSAALDIIGTLFVLRRPEVIILPSFTEPDIKYEAAGRIAVRPIFLLIAGMHFLKHLLQRRPAQTGQAPAPNHV